MTEEIFYHNCPICDQGTVRWQAEETVYQCQQCGLTIKEQTFLGLIKRDRYQVIDFGEASHTLAAQSLENVALPRDALQITLGNIYSDEDLNAIANGNLDRLRPVRTVLAQIILEQLNEDCYIQVNQLRRGRGPSLENQMSSYQPDQTLPRSGIDWADQGNLFCTDRRLVFPSNRFTFIRLNRKLIGVQAFKNGLAIQQKGDSEATYFVGCFQHEAALVAAYVMAKIPALRSTSNPQKENIS